MPTTSENKISENTPIKKRVFSLEHRQNLSKSRMGYIASEETRKKMSDRMKGKPMLEACRQGLLLANMGRVCSEETKNKIRNALLRRKRPFEVCKKVGEAHKISEKAKAHRIKLHESLRGRKMSDEDRIKRRMSAPKGEACHLWRGGKTPMLVALRKASEYKLWREAVYKRDNYTCVWCGKRGGRLNADHIKPFATYPELRFAIDNGRTLCEPCHHTTDTYGRPSKTKPTDNKISLK